jgi:hypothetical protein
VGVSRRASVIPWAGGGDGRTFFASLYLRSFSGVVRIDARTSHVTRIRSFPSARNDQADGSFDGRWLVWNEYHSLTDFFADFTTFAWDSRTGSVRQIGRARRDANGDFWPGPWRQPDVRGGLATWAQGTGPAGAGEVHVYDLRAGVDRVVRSGHPQGSFFLAGPIVVWPESLRPGTTTTMRAADARTGEGVPTPPALAQLRGVSGLFTDGRAIAYPNARYTELWWSPSPNTRPRRIYRTKRAADHVDNSVRVAGRYIIFGSQPIGYLVDTRTRRYMPMGVLGDAIDRRAVIVSPPTTGKALHPRSTIMFVPFRSLPRLPRCRT